MCCSTRVLGGVPKFGTAKPETVSGIATKWLADVTRQTVRQSLRVSRSNQLNIAIVRIMRAHAPSLRSKCIEHDERAMSQITRVNRIHVYTSTD